MLTRRALDDCFLHDRDRLRHGEALAILRDRLFAITGEEGVPLAQAAGRILAEDVAAPRDVPSADNSAVDGYAFAHTSLGDAPLRVATRIAAGHPDARPLPPGEAARIFTGALMPAGADTVAMQEDCRAFEKDGAQWVEIPPGLKLGANRRRAGEDLRAGEVLVTPGTWLRPQEVAAIASTGRDAVRCRKCLRVALFSTGDEIVEPGIPIGPGQVYDANRPLLASLLNAATLSVTDLGILPDRESAVRDALAQAAETHDVLLTSGGASRGEEDHVVTILDELGTRHLWQLAIKPGRPMTFGRVGNAAFFGLPGNPVAAFVCALLYVRPALDMLAGGHFREPVRYSLPAAFEIARKKTDRREFLRGILARDGQGRLTVKKFPRDGSGLITSLREADGLIELPEEMDSLALGQPVDFIPFSAFGI